MANNRLYLVDDDTGQMIGFAKSFGTWRLYDAEKLEAFLQAVDFRAAADGGRGSLRLVYESDIAEFVTAHEDEIAPSAAEQGRPLTSAAT